MITRSRPAVTARRSLAIAALLCLVGTQAWMTADAEVYRWTDKDGAVHYSDTPPAPGTKPTDLPTLQTFSQSAVTTGRPLPGSDSSASSSSSSSSASTPTPQADSAAASGYRPRITSPAPDDTYRDADGKVAIAVTPTPPPGVVLVYSLDGNALNQASPTTSTSYLARDVERGEHTVTVTALTRDGRAVGQSAPVTFYLMPPHVKK